MAYLNRVPPNTTATPKIDIVLVHGVDGDWKKTWTANNNPDLFWPKWLSDDFVESAVWSLDYEVHLTAWKGTSMPFADIALNAMDTLMSNGIGKRPVLFIGHSLGGLVIKQLLRVAIDSGNANYTRIVERTIGVMFLSTPHTGVDIASWSKYLGNILRTVFRVNVTPDELGAHDPYLRDLNIWYRNYTPTHQINSWAYYETLPTLGIMVVNPSASDPGIPQMVAIPVTKDHIGICKFVDRRDQVYAGVCNILRDFFEKSANDQNSEVALSEDHDDAVERLYSLFTGKYVMISDLEDFAFHLGLSSEDLTGATRPEKSRTLLTYCQSRGVVPKLVAVIAKRRDDLISFLPKIG